MLDVLRTFLIVFVCVVSEGHAEEGHPSQGESSSSEQSNSGYDPRWLPQSSLSEAPRDLNQRITQRKQNQSSSSSSEERHLKKCCACLVGEGFPEGLVEGTCKKFFKQESCKKNESFRIAVDSSSTFSDLPMDSSLFPTTCEEVKVYGSFHGLPEDYEIPFANSKKLAQRFKAKSVCYDGVTCLVFNETERVLRCAQSELGAEACSYSISGNQNIGVVAGVGFFGKVRWANEVENSTSRMTVFAGGGEPVRYTYDACSPFGAACSYINPSEISADDDPNKKKCHAGTQLTEQSCCRIKDKPLGGKWSQAGQGC